MDIDVLEKMGIHVVTEDEQNALLQAEKSHRALMLQLSQQFSVNPPQKINIEISVTITDKERKDFIQEIHNHFLDSDLTEEAILLHLVCDLTGYRSGGSDERMMAQEWLKGVDIHNQTIYAPKEFDSDTLHKVSYTLPLLDWEANQLESIAKQAALTADTLIECFIRDVAGYRPPGAHLGHDALNWLHRNVPNF